MTSVDLRAETRAYARSRLRELALDAARRVVLERGVGGGSDGRHRTEIGISRQSLHAEFGTKDDLGNALVLRETEEFFKGVQVRFAEHPGDLSGAVSDAAEYLVSVARENPLVGTILTGAPTGGDVSFLSLLTVQDADRQCQRTRPPVGDRTVVGSGSRRCAVDGGIRCAPVSESCSDPHQDAGGGRGGSGTGCVPVPAGLAGSVVLPDRWGSFRSLDGELLLRSPGGTVTQSHRYVAGGRQTGQISLSGRPGHPGRGRHLGGRHRPVGGQCLQHNLFGGRRRGRRTLLRNPGAQCVRAASTSAAARLLPDRIRR